MERGFGNWKRFHIFAAENPFIDVERQQYTMPAIVWLKVTDYMHGWLQWELGGALRVKDQKVVSVQHLPGARDILRMETVEDLADHRPVDNAMSDSRKNCILAGLALDPAVIEREYGITKDVMKLFMPIECPKMTLTKNGVLRPWTLDTCLSQKQTAAMQRLLREAFWKAVGEFNEVYARRMNGQRYPAVDMIEEFCIETRTPDLYVDAMRREWQRRVKREGSRL